MTGYSGTPLIRKLGIKPGMRICFLNPPEEYSELLGPLPEGVRVFKRLQGPIDFIQLFSDSKRQLQRRVPSARKALAKDGMLWISWPKRSSGVSTDLDGNIVRGTGLDHGLVDVKVCAVDETWSGLKFMYRVSDRG